MSIYWFKIKNNRNTSSKLVFISCSQNERVFGYLHSKIRRLFDFPHHCKFRLGFKNSEGKFAFINSSNQLLRILPNDDTRFPETSSHRQIALTVIPINFQELYEERFELDPNFVPIKPSQDARKSQSEDRDEQNSRHQRIFSSLKKLNEMIEAYHKETDSHMKSIEKEIKIAHCSSIKKIDTVHSTLKESENYFQAMTEEIKNDIKEHVTKTNDHVAPVDSLLKPNISLSDKKKVGLQQSDSLCNQCFCYITGKKWTCDTCDDFDLCLSCQTKIQHYPGHSLKCQKIAEKTNSVQCRNCCLNIPDSRYFCKGCPDFNVCLLCIQIVLKSHDTSHMFVLQDALSIHTTEYTYNNTLHTPTECNNCKETIYGIKYKCVTCNSYYLCEFCEILSDMFHSKYHAFIKIKNPYYQMQKVPSSPPVNQSKTDPEKRDREYEDAHKNSTKALTSGQFLNMPSLIYIDSPQKMFKELKIRNDGNRQWPSCPYLFYRVGESLNRTSVPSLLPGEEATVCICFQNFDPIKEGEYNIGLYTPGRKQFASADFTLKAIPKNAHRMVFPTISTSNVSIDHDELSTSNSSGSFQWLEDFDLDESQDQ